MAMNVIIIDANDGKGSKTNTGMSLVLDLDHCYQLKSKSEKCPLSAIHAIY